VGCTRDNNGWFKRGEEERNLEGKKDQISHQKVPESAMQIYKSGMEGVGATDTGKKVANKKEETTDKGRKGSGVESSPNKVV